MSTSCCSDSVEMILICKEHHHGPIHHNIVCVESREVLQLLHYTLPLLDKTEFLFTFEIALRQIKPGVNGPDSYVADIWFNHSGEWSLYLYKLACAQDTEHTFSMVSGINHTAINTMNMFDFWPFEEKLSCHLIPRFNDLNNNNNYSCDKALTTHLLWIEGTDSSKLRNKKTYLIFLRMSYNVYRSPESDVCIKHREFSM